MTEPIVGELTTAQAAQSVVGFAELRGFTKYVLYEDGTGRIVIYGHARDILEDGGASMAAQAQAGQTALAVSAIPNPATQYVVDSQIVARPDCPVTASVAGRVVTLTGVPVGAPWSISGTGLSGIADGNTLVVTFEAPGVYTILVGCFPAIDFQQEFTIA